MKSKEFIWQNLLEKVKTENQSLSLWLEGSDAVYNEADNKLNIFVKSNLHVKTLNKYKNELEDIFENTFNFKPSINIETAKESKKDISEKITIEVKQMPLPLFSSGNIPSLNANFRFNNFIIGTGNRFAHGACMSVAEAPGQSYNPLFIYGGVGLGKTHLLHAIGTYVHEKDPSKKIMVVTAEKFLYEAVQGMRDNKMEEFRDRYRSADLLLVDDIQYLQKGEKTREEFFHTFNELTNLNRQIVITSDVAPSQLEIEDRLTSRFSAGMIVDIQPPDFETRVAILYQKCKEENIKVPDNVIAFIAEHINSNIRELNGTLVTFKQLSEGKPEEMTIELAKKAIKIRNPKFEQEKKIGVDFIQTVVSDFYNIKVQEMLSKKRHENIAMARQVAMYLTRELTNYSLMQIGQYFGGKDHTTVMHAISKVDNLIKSDEKFKTEINEIINRIKK